MGGGGRGRKEERWEVFGGWEKTVPFTNIVKRQIVIREMEYCKFSGTIRPT